jgi:hypothetical protein
VLCHSTEFHFAKRHSVEHYSTAWQAAQCHFDDCHSAKCRFAESHSTDCHFAQSHSTEYHFDDTLLNVVLLNVTTPHYKQSLTEASILDFFPKFSRQFLECFYNKEFYTISK